jgi:hypothetical protein
MTSHFTADHADALVSLAENGAPVSFAHVEGDGTYLADLDMETYAAPVPVTGQAMRVKGDPKVYAALSLVEADAPTLLFAPDVFGTEPQLGMFVTWGAHVYAVRSVNPIAPDGPTIMARVVIAR